MDDEYKANFTDEGVHYVREMLTPFIERLNVMTSLQQLEEFRNTIPHATFIELNSRGTDIQQERKNVLNEILDLLLYDRKCDEPGVDRNTNVVSPWDIVNYINNEQLQTFFHPPSIMVTVTLDQTSSEISLTCFQVLGIMAVYRYLHLPHPLSMYGFALTHEVDIVNDVALDDDVSGAPEWYNINVGDDLYDFYNLEFLQGLITGARWNNLDPHTFISNFKQWKIEPSDGPIVGIPFENRRFYTIDLTF
ncbi:Hypothetical protein HVR_LOCUS542 [uncultured virus]|nr:Hypothetical protein HVR_LOCUS542 [uncultured virus]